MQQPLPDHPNKVLSTSEEINPEDIFKSVSWDKILEEDEEDENED